MLYILDAFGMIFGISGAIMVGQLNRWGFISFMIGSLSHGTMGFMQGNYGLMITCIVFLIIDVYYFRQWTLREKVLNKAEEWTECEKL